MLHNILKSFLWRTPNKETFQARVSREKEAKEVEITISFLKDL